MLCSRCHGAGHITADCHTAQCARCLLFGHTAAQCMQKVCEFCYSTGTSAGIGHTVRECPWRKKFNV